MKTDASEQIAAKTALQAGKTDQDVLLIHLAEELISPQRTEPRDPRHLLAARHFKHPSSQHRFEAPLRASGSTWWLGGSAVLRGWDEHTTAVT